jgi:uncharacterized protein YkwD
VGKYFLSAGTNAARLRVVALALASVVIGQVSACDAPDAAIQAEIVELTNAARATAGCGPLTLNPLLNQAADGHSEDMAARNFFDHLSPEGADPGDRIAATGYRPRGWAENIAAGYPNADAVVAGWMNSTGHRENIVNCGYTEIGVGYATNPSTGDGPYWTQVFAIPG